MFWPNLVMMPESTAAPVSLFDKRENIPDIDREMMEFFNAEFIKGGTKLPFFLSLFHIEK